MGTEGDSGWLASASLNANLSAGKPEPDAYLLGAQLLGLAPQECVVVEDAPAGVLSGLAAGCHVIAVNAPADTPRLNEVDLVLHSLEQITVTKQPNGDVIIQ